MDRIFLLSLEEADKYFGDSGDYQSKRRKSNKDGKFVAANDGSRFSNAHDSDRVANFGDKACWWWLRSPGLNSLIAAYVDFVGRVSVYDGGVHGLNGGVRPALWLNL